MFIMMLYHVFHIVDQTELDKNIGNRMIQDLHYSHEASFMILLITAVNAVFQLLNLSLFGTVRSLCII